MVHSPKGVMVPCHQTQTTRTGVHVRHTALHSTSPRSTLLYSTTVHAMDINKVGSMVSASLSQPWKCPQCPARYYTVQGIRLTPVSSSCDSIVPQGSATGCLDMIPAIPISSVSKREKVSVQQDVGAEPLAWRAFILPIHPRQHTQRYLMYPAATIPLPLP